MSNAKLKATLKRRRSSMEFCGTHGVTCNQTIKTVPAFTVWC